LFAHTSLDSFVPLPWLGMSVKMEGSIWA